MITDGFLKIILFRLYIFSIFLLVFVKVVENDIFSLVHEADTRYKFRLRSYFTKDCSQIRFQTVWNGKRIRREMKKIFITEF